MKRILIYHFYPDATTRACVEEAEKMLARLADPAQYKIEKVTGKYLRTASWEKDAALLVIPGGRARPNYENIGETGNEKIRQFIKSGGSYLGICAGGYYGTSKTVFEKGGPLEIKDEGPLYFYSGTAEGPVYGLRKFRYQSEAGAQLSKVSFHFSDGSHETVPMYFNGGCYFHGGKKEGYSILGKFHDIVEAPAAIIECKVGQGQVILSGVHFEFSCTARNLQSPKMAAVREALRESQDQRDKVLMDMLGRLRITAKKSLVEESKWSIPT